VPKLQKPNVSAELCLKLTDYLTCGKRRNHPRINYKICEVCRYVKKCASFKSFRETRPDLYPPPEVKKKRGRARKKK
jgi:hypothetical protein